MEKKGLYGATVPASAVCLADEAGIAFPMNVRSLQEATRFLAETVASLESLLSDIDDSQRLGEIGEYLIVGVSDDESRFRLGGRH